MNIIFGRITKNSTIFLAIVLITGTITALSSLSSSSLSFMTNTQAQSYYYGRIGNRYNNYESTSEYQSYENSNYESTDSSSLNVKKIILTVSYPALMVTYLKKGKRLLVYPQ